MHLTTTLDYALVAQALERELKLLVRLQAPLEAQRRRKPLNLGVVLDRSGSMAGDKIEHTKLAIKTLITHLGSEDYLSLVQFDEDVQVLLEPTPVKDKDALKHLVDRIDTGGSTNLSGGWLEGLRVMRQVAGPERIHRCLLLTDGQANVGLQDPEQLAQLGQSARKEFGIVTTTLGFGEGFNEDLLTAIAKASGGAFYFVDQAEQAPAIFREELEGLLQLAARNIVITLHPEAPVQLVAQWTDYPSEAKPTGIAYHLGDAYAGEEKNLLVSLLVPGLKQLGPMGIVDVEVAYAQIGASAIQGMAIRQTVRVNVTDEESARSATPDVSVQQQYGLQFAAKARKQAVAEADRGDYRRAKQTLQKARETLAPLPDPGDLLASEIKELEEQGGQLDAGTYTRARKLMREAECCMSVGNYQQSRNARERRKGAGQPPAASKPAAKS